LELKRIDAAKEIAKILSHSNNRVFINSENLMIDRVVGNTSQNTSGGFSRELTSLKKGPSE